IPAWREGTSVAWALARVRTAAGTELAGTEAVRMTVATCGAPPLEIGPTRIPEAANPPEAPRCAAATAGINSSTPTNPNIIRGFIILSAAPHLSDAAKHATVADTLPPFARRPTA